MLVREFLDRLDIFIVELNLLEVLRDTGSRYRLGDDGVATDLAPGQDDLSGSSPLLLSDGLDLWSCDEKRDVEEVVAKGRVGGDVNVLLLGVGDELVAGEDRVALDLVNSRNNAGLVDELLEGLRSEVGYTSGASLALRECVYSLPCLAVGNGVVDIDLVGIGGGREKIRVRVLTRTEVYGPVNEVEVL